MSNSYAINWNLLSEDQRDYLDNLGLILGTNYVEFTKEITWDQMKLVLAYMWSVYNRTLNKSENHVGFAIGDCFLYAEQKFGKKIVETFQSDYIELMKIRDTTLLILGSTLMHLQSAEHLIKGCCSFLKLKGIKFTIDDFLSNDPKLRKATTGRLKKALAATQAFNAKFENQLDKFAKDRNFLVHELCIESNRKIPSDGIPEAQNFKKIIDYCISFEKDLIMIERIFRGLMVSICQTLEEKDKTNKDYSILYKEWSKYLPDFKNTLAECN